MSATSTTEVSRNNAEDVGSRSLRGQAALVLGASRGLGRAIAIELANNGVAVGVGCRSRDDAEDVEGEIVAAGGHACALQVDVTRSEDVASAVAAARERFGRFDILVNNAAIIEPIARLEQAESSAWLRVMHVNLLGALHGAKHALAAFSSGGTIVNISSSAAETTYEGWGAYCCSKAAMVMLTRMIDHEHRDQGVFAFGFRPGGVDTDMQETIRRSRMNPVSRAPREKLRPPEEPAQAVVRLIASRREDLAGREIDINDLERAI